jgi:3-vinyl bacteriochlorophyllide hydratase
MLSSAVDRVIAQIDNSPYGYSSGRMTRRHAANRRPVYTAEERARRDRTHWTMVQGLLAPFQFVVFAVSLALLARWLLTGEGLASAELSVVVKTLVLYAIMVTGSIWEKVVFGKYLFAESFFWEDVFSMLVIGLHTAYVGAFLFGWGDADFRIWLALAAYAAYLINAVQFVMKLRQARQEARA